MCTPLYTPTVQVYRCRYTITKARRELSPASWLVRSPVSPTGGLERPSRTSSSLTAAAARPSRFVHPAVPLQSTAINFRCPDMRALSLRRTTPLTGLLDSRRVAHDHESSGHLRYIRLKKIGRTRRRPLEGARTRHQRAAAMPVCCRWLGRVWCTATDPGMFSVRHTCRLRHTMCATCIRTRPWLPDDIGQLRHYFDAHTEALHGAPEPEFAFQLPGEVRPTTGQRHRWRDG